MKIETIRQLKPYRGYSMLEVSATIPGICTHEAILCEKEGQRSVFAANLAMAKHTIDTRESAVTEKGET